ncbi:hypothetical protein ES708_02594 [subsurface metagenome]
MKLRKVEPASIQIPEVRVTARFDDEIWAEFQNSIKEIGAIAPIICCLVGEELVLVDGLHRLVEAQRNGTQMVDVAVVEGDMVDVLTKNLFLDHMRGRTPVSEMVNVIESLWKEYGLDSEKIAERTGMTRDYVEKLQLLSELTPLCREALDEGRIGVGHAEALTKIKDPVRQETVLAQQLLYQWPIKELVSYIKDVLELVESQPEREAAKEARGPVKVKCSYCGEEYDPAELAAPVTCRYCSGRSPYGER